MPRPPILRQKILKVIGTEGPLSKKMVNDIIGHHGADISQAVDSLLKEGLLVYLRSGIRLRIGEMQKSGRPHRIYILSQLGMESLLSSLPPAEFWRMISTFCYFQNKRVSSELVNKVYEEYLMNYLGYSTLYLSDFMLDSVNLICEDWYKKIRMNSNDHTAEKVLEALAVNGSLPIHELSERIHEDESKIQKILTDYSSRIDKSSRRKDNGFTDSYPSQAIQLVASKSRREKFRLTLVGILLVLYLIRKRDMEGLDNSLLDASYSIEEYYMKVASNYHDKIPLIFGKWSKLKQSFGIMSTFNIDIILDKKFRVGSLSSSGNIVLYNCMSSIFPECKRFLYDLQASAFFEMMNIVAKNYLTVNLDYEKARRRIWNKLLPVYELWLKLSFVLVEKLYDYDSIRQMLSKDEALEPENMASIISLYSVETMEKSLEKEITTVYYMNLINSYKFRVMPSHYLSKVAEKTYYGIEDSPAMKLSSLLKEDEEIREIIDTMFRDAVNYHKRLTKAIESFKPELAVF